MMMTKRDPEATRRSILDAAEECFLAKGYADTATSAIARKAKITKSLIHHHFGSKEELWQAVKVRRFGEYAERKMQMLEASSPGAELLRESFQTYFQFLRHSPQLVRLMTWMYLEGDEECTQMNREVMERGVETLRQAQEAGRLREDIDPRHLLISFLGIIEHWFQAHNVLCMHMDMTDSEDEIHRRHLENTMKIFFEGVLPR